MHKKTFYKILAGLAVFFVAYILYFTAPKFIEVSTREDTTVSEFVVIDEFKGKDFSSVDEFRENSIKGPQYIDIENYNLEISGLVENPLNLTYKDVIDNNKHYQKDATLNCVEGWSVRILWEGVLLKDLLQKAIPKTSANTIIFHAYDGYTTSFPIEYIMENNIVMAHKMNDEVLSPERGFPFQLVAETKWGYKWIKWITKIEFSDDKDYEGYWESRGYNHKGNLNEDRFENQYKFE